MNIELPDLVRNSPAEASAGCRPLLEVNPSRTTRLQLPPSDPGSLVTHLQGTQSRLVGYKTFYSRAMVDLGVQKFRPAIGWLEKLLSAGPLTGETAPQGAVEPRGGGAYLDFYDSMFNGSSHRKMEQVLWIFLSCFCAALAGVSAMVRRRWRLV